MPQRKGCTECAGDATEEIKPQAPFARRPGDNQLCNRHNEECRAEEDGEFIKVEIGAIHESNNC